MPQIFRRSSNTLARTALLGLFPLLGLFGWGLHAVYWSPYTTRVGVRVPQPVPFSHAHHVAGLGIDCRYCHTSVETSSSAGIPPTETCMTCHSQVWTDAPMLEPVRSSFARNEPIRWNRVHDLPDFVFFDHSIHVAKGIGCATCHGPVDQMPLMQKEHTLFMKWCLECHRAPERFVRPRDEIFNFDWKPPKNQERIGKIRIEEYHIRASQLTDCSICHR